MVKLDEEFLEPVARAFRFGSGMNYIEKGKAVSIADIGCGPKVRFYHAAIKSGVQFQKYFGVDPLLADDVISTLQTNPEIEIVKAPLADRIPLPDNSVDYCVAFAFLEHIDNPETILNDAVRVIKPDGKIVLTTPSFKAKPVLEFLSFKLKLISPREIEEHKNYFDERTLKGMVRFGADQVDIKHEYFEMGMNNLLVITKKTV